MFDRAPGGLGIGLAPAVMKVLCLAIVVGVLVLCLLTAERTGCKRNAAKQRGFSNRRVIHRSRCGWRMRFADERADQHRQRRENCGHLRGAASGVRVGPELVYDVIHATLRIGIGYSGLRCNKLRKITAISRGYFAPRQSLCEDVARLLATPPAAAFGSAPEAVRNSVSKA